MLEEGGMGGWEGYVLTVWGRWDGGGRPAGRPYRGRWLGGDGFELKWMRLENSVEKLRYHRIEEHGLVEKV